jgi:hypothetical protein
MADIVERLRRDGVKWDNYFVLFVDLLGQRDRLTPWLGVQAPISAECGDDLSRTVSRIAAWKQLFLDFATELPAGDADAPTRADWGPNDYDAATKEFEECRSVDIKSQQFGDTMILYAKPSTPDGWLNLRPLDLMIAAASFASVTALAMGLPLRGALNFGCATELQSGDLYGPALAHAHYLESKAAQWPRVVVGGNVLQVLYEVCSPRPGSFKGLYLQKVAQRCNSRLFMAEDHPTVEMVGERVADLYGAPDGFRAHGLSAYRYAITERNRLSQAPRMNKDEQERLLARYTTLVRYFESRGVSEQKDVQAHQ